MIGAMKESKKQNILFKVLCCMTSLFLILNCQSVWQNTINHNYHIYEFTLFFIILLCVYSIFNFKTSKKKLEKFKVISIFYLFIIVVLLILSVSLSNWIRFLSRFLSFPIILLFFFSNLKQKEKQYIFYCFINWVSIIAWITFVLWLFSSLGIIHQTGVIQVNWFGDYSNYFNLYFSSPYQMIDFINIGLRRNIGIFTEGPMFMIVLSFALMLMLLINDNYKISRFKIIGMVLAMLSTASITGYLIMAIIGAYIFIKNKKYIGLMLNIEKKFNIDKRYIKYIYKGLMIICVLLIIVIIFLKKDTASFHARFDDYITGLKCWMVSPLWGNGYENIEFLRQFMSDSRSWNIGFSNTVFAVLAYGGVLFAVPFVYPILEGLKHSVRTKNWNVTIVCFIYTLLYFTVIFYTFYINFFIWSYLICLNKNILKECKKNV